MNYAEIVICLTGLGLLAHWLLTTSLGRKALVDSPTRRNNMPFYMPLVALFVWSAGGLLAVHIAGSLTSGLPDWESMMVANIALYASAMMTAAIIIVIARVCFARRLKGFGLNLRALPGDLVKAPLYLLAAWPLIMGSILLTVYLVQLVSGREYQMHAHQQLKMITQHPQLALRVLVLVGSVIIVPPLEELMFRGIIQTTVRSYLTTARQPWLAIAISSGLFAVMHEDPGHWPALFVLGTCMGYAYEKSGSLWRPMFIHAMFNATSVIVTLSK